MTKHLLFRSAVGAFLVCGTITTFAKGGGHGQQTSGKPLTLEKCLEGHQLSRMGHKNWNVHHCVECPPGECVPGGGTFAKNDFLCSPANCRHP